VLSAALAAAGMLRLMRDAGPLFGLPVGTLRASLPAFAFLLAALLAGWGAAASLAFAAALPLAVGATRVGRGYIAGPAVCALAYVAAAVSVGGGGALALGEVRGGLSAFLQGVRIVLGGRQMIFHPVPPGTSALGAFGGLAAFALAMVGAWLCGPRHRTAALLLALAGSFCAGSFFTSVRGGVLWEHGLYLTAGCLACVVALIGHVASRQRWLDVAFVFAAAAACVAAFARSWDRSAVWASPELVWKEVLQEFPRSGVAKMELAGYYRDSGKPERAAELASPAGQDTLSLALALNNEGVAAKDRGDLQLAVRKFREALELWPDLRDAHFNLGVVYHALGMEDSAAARLQRAAELDPTFADARYNLGIVYAKMGDDERARRAYEEALAINPNHARAWANLGSLLARRGKMREAVANLERALQIDPGLLQARFNLALAYERVDPARAVQEWEEYVELARKRGVPSEKIRRAEARLAALKRIEESKAR